MLQIPHCFSAWIAVYVSTGYVFRRGIKYYQISRKKTTTWECSTPRCQAKIVTTNDDTTNYKYNGCHASTTHQIYDDKAIDEMQFKNNIIDSIRNTTINPRVQYDEHAAANPRQASTVPYSCVKDKAYKARKYAGVTLPKNK
eukprot:194130_1